MLRNKRVVALGLFLLVLLLGAAIPAVLYIRQGALPVYTEGELPPTEGYGNNTLMLGDATYISGRAEFRLRPATEPFGSRSPIGRTITTDRRVFRPEGQPGLDYIYLSGGEMMTEMVYRNDRLPPLELRDMQVSAIRLSGRSGAASTVKSEDAALIKEVMDRLVERPIITLRPNYDAGDRGYRLELFPQQIPGLVYDVDILADRAGQVYLSTESEMNQDAWIPAGELFTLWVRQ